MDKLDIDKLNIGIWNPLLAINPKKFAAINISPEDITLDQIIQLYLLLYPLIAADFSARTDLQSWASDIKKEMSEKFNQLSTDISSHIHVGNLGSPTSIPTKSISITEWIKNPEDPDYKQGERIVTNISTYTNKIDHRDPTKTFPNVVLVNVLPISVEYAKRLILIPFDVDEINTSSYGDNEFIGDLL